MKPLFAASLLLGTVVSANAADMAARPLYTKAPMAAAIYDWTGFYVGVNAGGGVGRSRTDHTIPGNSFDTFYQQPTGVLGGAQIGYNWQTNATFLGPMLMGLEADIQGADLRDNRTTLNGALGIVTNYNQRLDWFGTVRGRVGLVSGSTVSYVTGGYAYGDVRSTVTETPLIGAPAAFTTDRMRGGYVLGSGVEAALGGNWTGKIEYLYVDLGKRTDGFAALGVPQSMTTRNAENIFRAGLNYKIGGGLWNPAPANWTGFYLGGNFGSTSARDRTTLTSGALTEQFNLAPDGYNGGVQAGYNWQASAFMFGLEADIQGAYARDNKTCVATCSLVLASAYNAQLPWFGTARARLGYAVGSTLFYATGGYAYGDIRTRVSTNILGAVTQSTLSKTQGGYAVGGGIETPFTFLGLFGPSWTTKTEYLYVDLGRATNGFVSSGVPFALTTRVNEHVLRTGLNYHFNAPVVAKY